MVVSKLKALISDEVNKQLAENYQELLSKLVKIDVEHMEEDMSYAIGAAYFMIGGRLIFTPVIYRDGNVDSISYIGDVENDKLYGLTKKMYKKMTSIMAHDFGEVMSKKNEERARVDSGIVGQLFATPRTYSPKTASEDNDGMIVSALGDDTFRSNFRQLMADENYTDVMGGVYGDMVSDRMRDVDTFSKTASYEKPVSKRRFETISSLRALPLEKRASAAIEIARNGFFEENVTLNKVAAQNIPKFGEQLINSSGNTVVAKEPGVYNFIGKDYGLVKGFIGRIGFSSELMIVTPFGALNVEYGHNRERGYDNEDKGFLAIEGSFFKKPTSDIAMIAKAFDSKKRKKDKGNSIAHPMSEDRAVNRGIIISPNATEVYIFRVDTNPVSVGDKKVYISDRYDSTEVEIIVDPSCRRFMRSEGRVICHPDMVTTTKEAMYGGFREEVKSRLLGTRDLDSPIVKTAEFTVGYKAGAYMLDKIAMPQAHFVSALTDKGFNLLASKEIVKVAESGQGSDVALQEMSQTMKAILAEITENKHTTTQVLELMSQAQGQGQADGAQQEDDPQTVQAIQEMAQMLGADPEQILSQAKEQGVPLEEIATEMGAAVEQQQGQGQAPQANVQPQEGAQQMDPAQAQGQPVDPAQAQAQGQGQPVDPAQAKAQASLQAEGFNQNMTPEMVQQLKEISDKDMFNAAIISYFVDSTNAGDVIHQYIDEIDGGVVAMAKVMLFIETQKGKMTETVGEKQISVFINRGKNILNRMTDFVIDATLIQ